MVSGLESSTTNNSENIESSSTEICSDVSDSVEPVDFESDESADTGVCGGDCSEVCEGIEPVDFEGDDPSDTEPDREVESGTFDDVEPADFESMESGQLQEVEGKTAYDLLCEYMSRHNYGPEDFEVYSQDPEWRDLHIAAYPDYEIPPLKEEIIENTTLRGEVLKDFEGMGISFEGIDEIPLEMSVEIKEAIEEMYEEYPEVKDLLRTVVITDELDDGTFAAAGPKVVDSQLVARILINKNEFNETLSQRLSIYKSKGFFAGEGNKAVIKHEIGHILQLKLDADSAGLCGGDFITGEAYRQKYNEMIDKWNENEHTDIILENALKNLSLSRKDITRELSVYGATNSAEALAEAISEVNTSSEPRRLAVEIVKEYEKLKQEMEGK